MTYENQTPVSANASNANNVEPFVVAVSDSKLSQILHQVRSSILPKPIGQTDWSHGVSHAFMEKIVSYWGSQYDWRRFESDLNEHPQFRAAIDGNDLHFYHVKGKGTNSTPLLLTHGWPGSVIEYVYLIDRLTDPARYGGNDEDAFTVVIPSLPGYGFSSQPSDLVGPVKTAHLLHKLMTEVLGYRKFATHAGDLGGLMQVQLAHLYPDNVIGAHFLNIATNPVPQSEMTDVERQWASDANVFMQAEMSYFPQQMLKPNTVAYALENNPVGFAAWVIEKIHAWSDHQGDLEALLPMDRILDMVMVYLVTDTAGSALNYYGAIPIETNWMLHPGKRIEVPVAVANFPRDYINAHPPRSFAERYYNVKRWSDFGKGGHFAGLEQPDALVRDLREFFSGLHRA